MMNQNADPGDENTNLDPGFGLTAKDRAAALASVENYAKQRTREPDLDLVTGWSRLNYFEQLQLISLKDDLLDRALHSAFKRGN